MVKQFEDLVNYGVLVNFEDLDDSPFYAIRDSINKDLYITKGISLKDFFDWKYNRKIEADAWEGKKFIIVKLDWVDVTIKYYHDGKFEDAEFNNAGRQFDTYIKFVNTIIPISLILGVNEWDDVLAEYICT